MGLKVSVQMSYGVLIKLIVIHMFHYTLQIIYGITSKSMYNILSNWLLPYKEEQRLQYTVPLLLYYIHL